jgi:hypothetical protein
MKHRFPSPVTPKHGRNGCLSVAAAIVLGLAVFGPAGVARAGVSIDCSLHAYYDLRNARGDALGNGPDSYTLASTGHGDGFCTKANPTVNGNYYVVNASDSGLALTWSSVSHKLYDAAQGAYPASQSWGFLPFGSAGQYELFNYYANQLGQSPCLVGNTVGQDLSMGPCLAHGSASELWNFIIR